MSAEPQPCWRGGLPICMKLTLPGSEPVLEITTKPVLYARKGDPAHSPLI
jgi:hypothetical protein